MFLATGAGFGARAGATMVGSDCLACAVGGLGLTTGFFSSTFAGAGFFSSAFAGAGFFSSAFAGAGFFSSAFAGAGALTPPVTVTLRRAVHPIYLFGSIFAILIGAFLNSGLSKHAIRIFASSGFGRLSIALILI